MGNGVDKPRLLYVDDDGQQVEILQHLFAKDFQVAAMTSPHQALEVLKRDPFDIVLSDLMMPDMTGVEFLAGARRVQPFAGRVVTSAYTDAADILPAIDAGDVHHFVPKPVKSAELRSWLEAFAAQTESVRCLVVTSDRRQAERLFAQLAPVGGIEIEHATKLGPESRASVVILPLPDSPRAFADEIAALRGGREDIAIMVALSPTRGSDAAGYLAAGADEILWLPLRAEEVVLRYQTWHARREAAREAERVRLEVISQGPFPALVGRSPAMRRVFHQLHQVAPGNVTVLLTGQTGTGKEMMARALHALSHRRDGPFMALNLQAVPETLVEGELFGHEKGAFTGAQAARKGRLEAVAGGTLFLDEVGDLSAGTQVKLLRVIEDRTFERLGSTTSRQADFRLVCATNRPLEELVAEGRFREDLYYRINVVRIELPPLRERGDDVRLLAEHFLDTFRRANGDRHVVLSEKAQSALARHHWPGNVRELKHVIERAVAMTPDGGVVGEDLLSVRPRRESFRKLYQQSVRDGRGLKQILADIERTILVETLQRCGENQAAVAKKLKIPRQTLQNRLKKYGL